MFAFMLSNSRLSSGYSPVIRQASSVATARLNFRAQCFPDVNFKQIIQITCKDRTHEMIFHQLFPRQLCDMAPVTETCRDPLR